MACLDTTLLVDLLRSDPESKRRALGEVEALAGRGEQIVTTRLNLAELYVGIELSDDFQRGREKVRNVLSHLHCVLEFDDSAARLFGEITAHLQRIGRPAGDMDVLIAAVAIANGHCLVTRNASHFAAIPHLVVETY
jgi:predicted nucleic acid-binding protein